MKYLYFLLSVLLFCFNYSFAQNDSVFFKWRADTIKLVNSKPYQSTERLIRHYYKDSSVVFTELHLIDEEEDFLEIINYYKCKLQKADISSIKDKCIARILALLKEHKEIPNRGFTLSFKNIISYYPSEIANRKYGYVEDIKDISVELDDGSKTINYSYIRGRLSSKTEITSIEKMMK
jgi:hypothetical protein